MKQAFEGIYDNGTITLTENIPFSGKSEVLVIFTERTELPDDEKDLEKKIDELEERFSCVRIKTKDWKFDREEANER